VTTGPVGDALDRHASEHLRFEPVPHEQIAELEARLGRRLPLELAAMLEAVGNGIFFGREELFGPRRLMIHDIELLPGMMGVKAATPGLPDEWLPFHRCDGALHVVDLRPESLGAVYSWPEGAHHGDVGSFLASRLMPR
jgi:SMI1/KNR4 family protein SUKH-1